MSFGLFVPSASDSYFFGHDIFDGLVTLELALDSVYEAALVLNGPFGVLDLLGAFIVAEISRPLATFKAAHGVDCFHPRVFVPELAQSAFLEVELQGILFGMRLTWCLF